MMKKLGGSLQFQQRTKRLDAPRKAPQPATTKSVSRTPEIKNCASEFLLHSTPLGQPLCNGEGACVKQEIRELPAT